MTTYLFKNRFFCTDVFRRVFEEMVRRGYECIQVVDEDHPDPIGAIDSLKGKDVVLVTSDHLDDDMGHYNKRCYTVRDCLDILRPERSFFAMHDLGVSTIDDTLEGFHVLLPGTEWVPLYKDHDGPLTIVGHPKFWTSSRSERYEAVFFVSSVYVYAERPLHEFREAFAPLFEWAIPFKFPKYSLSLPLIEYVREQGVGVLDPGIESFDLLMQTRTAISNANSSIAVEAAMAGCNSINLGWSFQPTEVYEGFQILSVNDPDVEPLKREYLQIEPPSVREDLTLDMESCIMALV